MAVKRKRVNKQVMNRTRRSAGTTVKKVRKRAGCGLINSVIDLLPFELHLPTYHFCGPGTRLDVRLARGDPGINVLDAACKEHDLAYRASKRDNKPELRRAADEILFRKAMQRVTSPHASVAEKLAALVVAGAMKGKLMIGGGIRSRRGRQ